MSKLTTSAKALLTAATMTALIAGVTTANAWDRQATGAEMDYALSKQAAGQDFGSAYASVRVPGHIRTHNAVVPTGGSDFQLQGR